MIPEEIGMKKKSFMGAIQGFYTFVLPKMVKITSHDIN
jgi:hypothetical protein